MLHFKKEFEEIFGLPVTQENHEVQFMHASATTCEQVKKFMALIFPWMESMVSAEIANLSKQNLDYLLVGYWNLSRFKIWAECDFRLVINADKDITCQRLRERTLKKYGFLDDGMTEIIFRVCEDSVKNARNANCYLWNNFESIPQLKSEIDNISKNIKALA